MGFVPTRVTFASPSKSYHPLRKVWNYKSEDYAIRQDGCGVKLPVRNQSLRLKVDSFWWQYTELKSKLILEKLTKTCKFKTISPDENEPKWC